MCRITTPASLAVPLLAFVMTLGAAPASAAPLGLYGGPVIDKTSAGCLTVGDAVSCSAGVLNLLSGRSATAKTTDVDGGYVIATPQGALKEAIVVGMGGNSATDNSTIEPTVGKVENGYKTNSGGDNYVATGTTGSTIGSLGDPDNNALRSDADFKGTWDVEIGWLKDALTVGGARRELMIGFDYNQTQGGKGGSLNYWALITVIDLDDRSRDVNYEIGTAGLGSSYSSFQSTKSFNSQPTAADFAVVNTITCVKTSGGAVVDILPQVLGNCPAGYDTKVENAQSTSTTEIIAFLPELDTGLEGFLAAGYDSISVRMAFGCFGGTDDKNGQGYLSGGGQTTYCDLGGNTDIYLLAGAPHDDQQVPEPGTLALAGLSLGLLAAGLRRRRA